MCEEWTAADEAVEEVREIRRQIWERFEHDPGKYLAHLRERHEQLLREGWVEAPPPPPEYVRRVRQALARVRRYPHLLESAEEGGSAGGDQGESAA